MTTPRDILADLVSTLRDANLFAHVVLGDAPASSAVPRAAVAYDGLDQTPVEDDPRRRQIRLRARIFLHTRSDRPAQAAERLAELAQAVEGALLADPTRGGFCYDLPVGRATEIGRVELPRDQRDPSRQSSLAPASPAREACITVRCHWEALDAIELPTVLIDGATLFDSGPTKLVTGHWPRETVRRPLAGRDAEVVLDLGRRARTLTQTGRLEADTSEALQQQIDAIEALANGATHTLVDEYGRTLESILLERLTCPTPITHDRVYWVDYEVSYLQLP